MPWNPPTPVDTRRHFKDLTPPQKIVHVVYALPLMEKYMEHRVLGLQEPNHAF